MKRTYIAPQTDIEALRLRGSVMDDPSFGAYSPVTEEGGANTMTIDESDMETEIISSPNLWDE